MAHLMLFPMMTTVLHGMSLPTEALLIIMLPVVLVNPSVPSETTSFVITFNASLTALVGSPKVYLHAGVSTDPENVTAFSHVVGNWGLDDGIGEMTTIGANLWQITIPNAMAYFNVNNVDDLFGLNFLFRSADGSLKEVIITML